MDRRKFASPAGYTIVEIIVATGLFGILASGFAVTSMAFLKNSHYSNMQITRDQIVTELRIAATHPRSLVASIKHPANTAFRNCVCGVGTCANMKEPFAPFTLVDSSGVTLSDANYDSSGIPCNAANPKCQVRVRTKFFAQCHADFTSISQNPTVNCDGTPAEFVGIYYTIDENPASANEAVVHIKPISGPVYIQVSELPAGACL